MMIKNRDFVIDIMKGLGIFCMVAGHAAFPFVSFVFLFHMAIFFMASGYCYKEKNSDDIRNVLYFVKRKFLTLWIPYVLWTAIYSILHNFFIAVNIYTDNPELLEIVKTSGNVITEYWGIRDVIANIYYAFLFQGGTQMSGAFWFLAALMELSVTYCVIDYVLKKILKKNKLVNYSQLLISVLFLCIGFWCFKTDHYFKGFNRVFSCYILFYSGILIRKYNISGRKRSVAAHSLIFLASFIILIVCNKFGKIGLDRNTYVNPLFLLIASYAGWQFLYEMAFFIQKLPIFGTGLVCMGQNTMPVVIFHFLCFKIVSYIGVLLLHKPLFLVAAFPVLFHGGAWWIAYTIVGLIVPITFGLLYKKVKGVKKAR